jgi:hypothetical protein
VALYPTTGPRSQFLDTFSCLLRPPSATSARTTAYAAHCPLPSVSSPHPLQHAISDSFVLCPSYPLSPLILQ